MKQYHFTNATMAWRANDFVARMHQKTKIACRAIGVALPLLNPNPLQGIIDKTISLQNRHRWAVSIIANRLTRSFIPIQYHFSFVY